MVANKFLQDVEMTDNERKEVVPICQYFHTSARQLSERYLDKLGRHNYVTPTSYLELISSLKTLLGKKQDEVCTVLAFVLAVVENYHMFCRNCPVIVYLIYST